GFAKNIQRGRVYRLVHDDYERDTTKPKMLEESSAELVAHLEHANGWWRDTAQKQLILRADQSVGPALEALARNSESDLTRMHAIWTLEGLGSLSADLAREKMKDGHASVRRAAIRASESLIKNGVVDLQSDIVALAKDPDPEVVIQSLLTAKLLKFDDYETFAHATMTESESRGVKEIGKQMLSGGGKSLPKMSSEQLSIYKEGQTIYASLCFACHGGDGMGTPIPGGEGNLRLAPSLAGSRIMEGSPELATKVVLHGLTGPVEGKTYPGEMISMASNGDKWVASVLSYVRNSFGNQMPFVTEEEVKRIREENADRESAWTEEELLASVPNPVMDRSNWKLSASHKAGDVSKAIDGNLATRYTTGQSMQPGMWLQVELPEPIEVAGLILDAAGSRNDYPRGCEVHISTDGETWSEPIRKKEEQAPRIMVDIPEQPAKFIRITQTGKHRLYWSIHDLQVLKPAE
ncbi:MAG: discoidin domain-containing protein, partial [Verrucomicrobiota bacterium]